MDSLLSHVLRDMRYMQATMLANLQHAFTEGISIVVLRFTWGS